MKRNYRSNAGFTLVELIVALAISTIVTAAATSVLLMGLQVNRQSVNTANQYMTVRALLDVMENAAAEGKINAVFTDTDSSWQLGETVQDGEDKTINPIFSYNAKTQEIQTNGATILEGVYASNAIMEGQLLNLSIETKEGTFTSSVYCRTAAPVTDSGIGTVPGEVTGTANLNKFIEILKSQYRSRGQIQGGYADVGKYYSEWYIGGYDKDPRWNADTPWCACYVSWAIAETYKAMSLPGDAPKYANVDEFIKHFPQSQWTAGGEKPYVGDIVFFDWDKGTDPEHVGVVLSVTGTMVYTIEGNSAGRVTVRSYSLGDPRIIGYGRIFG